MTTRMLTALHQHAAKHHNLEGTTGEVAERLASRRCLCSTAPIRHRLNRAAADPGCARPAECRVASSSATRDVGCPWG